MKILPVVLCLQFILQGEKSYYKQPWLGQSVQMFDMVL